MRLTQNEQFKLGLLNEISPLTPTLVGGTRGRMIVRLLIRGRKLHRVVNLPRTTEYAQKVIVFTAYTLHLNQELVSTLLDLRFKLYVLKEGKPVQINSLNDFSRHRPIDILTPQKIQLAFKQNNLPYKDFEIEVVDQFKLKAIKRLLNSPKEDELEDYTLDFKHLLKLSEGQFNQLLESLASYDKIILQMEDKKVSHDFKNRYYSILEIVLNLHAERILGIKTNKLTSRMLELLSKYNVNLQYINTSLDDKATNFLTLIKKYKNLEYVLTSFTKLDALPNILNELNTHRLQRLAIEYNNREAVISKQIHHAFFQFIKNNSFPNLRILDVLRFCVSFSLLSETRFPNLTHIKFASINLDQEILLDMAPIKNIWVNFNVAGKNSDFNPTYRYFLHAMKGLENLNIGVGSLTSFANFELPANAQFLQLKTLNIDTRNVHSRLLKNLITQSPHLEELHINSQFDCINTWFKDENIVLTNIKNITLNMPVQIESDIFNRIAKLFPNVEKINLNHAYQDNVPEEELYTEFKFTPRENVTFLKLKELRINRIRMHYTDFAELGCAMPNLEQLTISYSEFLYQNQRPPKEFFKNLTELHLLEVAITVDEILENCPNLKILSISNDVKRYHNGKLVSPLEWYEGPVLSNLEKLIFNDIVIDDGIRPILESFIKQAPNLKHLAIKCPSNSELDEKEDEDKISADFFKEINLEKLEAISLESCRLTTEAISVLNNRAKNLFSLTIHNCIFEKPLNFSDMNDWDNLSTLILLNIGLYEIDFKKFPQLVSLQLLSRSQFLDKTINYFLENKDTAPHLYEIKFWNLDPGQSKQGYKNIKQQVKKLQKERTISFNYDSFGFKGTLRPEAKRLASDLVAKKNTELVLRKFFKAPPEPNQYRLSIYTSVSFQEGKVCLIPLNDSWKLMPIESFKITSNINELWHQVEQLKSLREMQDHNKAQKEQLKQLKNTEFGQYSLGQLETMNFCTYKITLTNSPTPLPSISPQDKITHIQINTDLLPHINIGYSKVSSRYSLSFKQPYSPVHTQIQYIVQDIQIRKAKFVGHTIDDEDIQAMRRLRFNRDGTIDITPDNLDIYLKIASEVDPAIRIQYIINFTVGFGDNLKKLLEDLNVLQDPEDIDRLNLYIANRVGACAERTVVALALAEAFGFSTLNSPHVTKHSVPDWTVWTVVNDGHAFLEFTYNKIKYRADLSGWNASVIITEQAKDVIEPSAPLVDLKQKLTATMQVQDYTTGYKYPSLTSPAPIHNYIDFCLELIKQAQSLEAGKQNVLAVCKNYEHVFIFNAAMMIATKLAKQNYCFVPSIDGISESEECVPAGKTDIESAESPWVNFLQQNGTGLFMVDLNNYELGDNTYMDDGHRRLRKQEISPGMIVIGVTTEAQSPRHLEENSRIKLIVDVPAFNENTSEILYTNRCLPVRPIHGVLKTINLYHSIEWEEILLGRIMMIGDMYQIIFGELIELLTDEDKLQQYAGIEFINAPNSVGFQLFLSELMHKRKIHYNNQDYFIPESDGFIIVNRELPYQLNQTIDQVDIFLTSKDNLPETPSFILNAETYFKFFENNTVQNKKNYPLIGWLSNGLDVINIMVTEFLPDSMWAKILDYAALANKRLEIVACDINFIPFLLRSHVKSYNLEGENSNQFPSAKIITTNDIHLAEECLEETFDLVVSIDKSMNDELLENIIPIRRRDNHFDLNWSLGSIFAAWQNGGKVLIKGHIPEVLLKQIESLFLPFSYVFINGEVIQNANGGQLVFLTDQPVNHPFITPEVKWLDLDMKWEHLIKKFTDEIAPDEIEKLKRVIHFIEEHTTLKFSYLQLKQILDQLKVNCNYNPLMSYMYLNQIANAEVLELVEEAYGKDKKGKAKNEGEKRDLDLNARLDSLTNHLENNLYTLVIGPTGIGKTATITDHLETYYAEKHHKKIHLEEGGWDKIKEFLTRPIDEDENDLSILLVDENDLLPPGTFETLSGAYNKTPGVLIEGQFYPIDPTWQKFVFLGNFLTYEHREKHNFFFDYGNCFYFHEYSDNYLCEGIISPALRKALDRPLEDNLEDLQETINMWLRFYHAVNTFFPSHPFSLRNLKMLALRYANFTNKPPHLNPASSARMAMYDELRGVLSNSEFQQFANSEIPEATFIVDVAGFEIELMKDKDFSLPPFTVTESRKHLIRTLEDLISRRNQAIAQNNHSTMGTCGVLIEGTPGIGKSEIVQLFMASKNFRKATTLNAPLREGEELYYLITPTDQAEMIATALKAFHEGRPLVIDEFDALLIEKEINTLMGGKDLLGKSADKPGFVVIATQNGEHMPGRKKLSPAQKNRFYFVDLPEYTTEELFLIIKNHIEAKHLKFDIPDNQIQTKIHEYEKRVTDAKATHAKQIPNLRHLKDHVDKYVEILSKQHQEASREEYEKEEVCSPPTKRHRASIAQTPASFYYQPREGAQGPSYSGSTLHPQSWSE